MALTPTEQRLKTKLLGGKTPTGQEVLKQKLTPAKTTQPTTGMTTEEILERGRYLASTPTGEAAFGVGGERLYDTPTTPATLPKPSEPKTATPPAAKYDEAYLRGQQPIPTGEQPKPKEPTDTKIATDTKDMTADWQTQFDKMMEGFKTAQTESQKKQEDIYTKLGETATTDMLAKFEETQKSMSDAYESYFDEQSAYLKELQEQPSMVDQLKQFREEQGLPQMEQMLQGVDQSIMDTEGLLANIEQDIRTRTEGLPVSESAARRLQAMEQKPLTKQMDELLRSRQRVAAGLTAKQATVEQFMGAQQEEIAKQKEIAQARLGFAGEKAEFKGDIATQSFDLFTKLQDRMIDIDKLRLDVVKDEATYKQELAKMGFDFFTQMQAAQQAGTEDKEKFERQLILEQFKSDLKTQNPGVKMVDDFTDRAGNVTMVTTYEDGSKEVVQLGQVGKEAEAAKGEVFDIGGEQLDLSTVAGVKRAAELGASYSDIFSAMDTQTKQSVTTIKNLLSEAEVKSPKETEELQKATGELRATIKDYQDDWKEKGEKEAGTREEFIKDMVNIFPELSEQEISAEVYKQVSNEWLDKNKKGRWWWPESALGHLD